jgi:FkbM family methyltransferase
LPEQFKNGALLVSPDSALKFWRFNLATVDQSLLDIALEHVGIGDIVWDIGANVGLFTFAAANLVGSTGSVLSIEADTWLCDLLSRSKRLNSNSHLNVDILPVAVSDSIDILQFNIASRGRSANFLDKLHGSSQTGGYRETKLVPSLNLDFIISRYKAPNFIKIDVEGAEALVLKGAQKLLTDIRPIIYCEVFSENIDSVSRILHDHKYQIFDGEAKKSDRTPLEKATYNTLAYPQS